MFRSLFGKNPFAKVTNSELLAERWDTGIPELDLLLTPASVQLPRAHLVRDMSLEALISAHPTLGAVLGLAPEDLGHAMGIAIILHQRVERERAPMITAHVRQVHAHLALRVLSDDLGGIREADALHIFAKDIATANTTDPTTLPVLTALLRRSFPDGPSSKLAAAVSKAISQRPKSSAKPQTYPARWGLKSQAKSIRALETWMGRDPNENPNIQDLNDFNTRALAATENAKIGAHAINLEIIEGLQKAKISGLGFLQTFEDRILGLSAEGRAEFVTDAFRLRNLLATDPAWKEPEQRAWVDVSAIYFYDVFRAYRPTHDGWRLIGDLTKGKLQFTPAQAERVLGYILSSALDPNLGDAIELRQESFNVNFQFARSLARVLGKDHENWVEKILARRWNEKAKAVLVKALQDSREQPTSQSTLDEKARGLIIETRKTLTDIISQLPDLWIKLPSTVVAGAWGDSIANSWSALNWQLFPYRTETIHYATAIIYALREGIDVTKDIADFKRLRDQTQANLLRIEAGEGRRFELEKKGLRENVVRLAHPDLRFGARLPKYSSNDVSDFSDTIESVQPSQVINTEQKMLTTLEGFIQLIDFYAQNPAWLRFEQETPPPKTGSRPSAIWVKKVKAAYEPDLQSALIARIKAHSPGVETLNVWEMRRSNDLQFDMTEQAIMRGVLWAAHLCDPHKIGPILVDFVMSSFVTKPGIGIKAEKLGNAAMWALENMADGAGAPYLARILSRTRYPKVRKRIDASLNIAAQAADMTRIELDEITAPDHDLASGQRRIEIADGAALVSVAGSKVAIAWENAAGKTLKSPPKAMVEAAPDAVKDVRALKKEIEKDIATQSRWLESLYLKNHTVPYAQWRTRYADHGTNGFLARRLLWLAKWDSREVVVLPSATGCVDIYGQAVDCSTAQMTLWHPVMSHEATVIAWRKRVLDIELLQPFKQAWREAYTVTDAERATATYSNRFAGHILRQHQMMTLAHLNGWKCTHRMWVDAPNDEPSHIKIPAYNLYAEFWTEGAGGEDPPVLDSCAYTYITTDRVKFHTLDPDMQYGRGDELEIAATPEIVFSEIMRHCDLFTSIASISIDPEWLDRGANAEHPSQWQRREADAYWNNQLTADLRASAQTRRAFLAEILPRLQAGKNRFSLKKNHLLVRGKKQKYLIHLGSGAAMRAADGRHICIVKGGKSGPKVFLPFEGDATLSLILSKAFLLADDHKITDPVILRQL